MTPEPSQRDDALQRDTVLLGVPPASRKAWLIFSMWMRPSCTASTPLAISISLCAAVVDQIAAGLDGLPINENGPGGLDRSRLPAESRGRRSAGTKF